jgi:hypothetical protein
VPKYALSMHLVLTLDTYICCVLVGVSQGRSERVCSQRMRITPYPQIFFPYSHSYDLYFLLRENLLDIILNKYITPLKFILIFLRRDNTIYQ